MEGQRRNGRRGKRTGGEARIEAEGRGRGESGKAIVRVKYGRGEGRK